MFPAIFSQRQIAGRARCGVTGGTCEDGDAVVASRAEVEEGGEVGSQKSPPIFVGWVPEEGGAEASEGEADLSCSAVIFITSAFGWTDEACKRNGSTSTSSNVMIFTLSGQSCVSHLVFCVK